MSSCGPFPLEINLEIYAAQCAGRHPRVVSHSWYWYEKEDNPGEDVIVLQDDTYERWTGWIRGD